MPLLLILALVITGVLSHGCASNYSPRADISSVQTIGVVVPPGSSEPHSAEDVIQLHNLTIAQDRVKNSAKGAGAGVAVGTAAGAVAGALIGCTAGGVLAPLCWTVVLVGGAAIGGTTGAVAGATVDDRESVVAAPVHLYEVNQVLPDLKHDYLDRSVLQKQALQIVREQDLAISFVPAAWDGKRYAPADATTSTNPTLDINLVLTAMNVSLVGKAENEPDVFLNIVMQWTLTKYNADTQNDEVWDVMSGNYESKKRLFSEWLVDDGALLKEDMDRGIKKALTYALSHLQPMAGIENAESQTDLF